MPYPTKDALTGLLAATMIAASLAGCGDASGGGEAAAESPDGRDAVAIPGGKADQSPYSSCELEHILLWLNDPATTLDSLTEAGVHARGAGNIIAHRNGPDGEFLTADDDYFDDAVEVDDVYWVGPVAIDQLTDAIADWCVEPPQRTAEAVFSPQPYHRSHLARVADLIDGATRSLDVAMYSFGDEQIFDALEAAVGRGIRVRMLFHGAYDDRNDSGGGMSARLERAGVDVRWVNKIMHHKFVIADGPRDTLLQAPAARLATGSGNWSYSAGTRYDENTVFATGDAELALRFQAEFNHLWNHSRDFAWQQADDLDYFESLPIVEAAIPDGDGVDAAFTSANFRAYVSSRYGNTFGIVRGRNTVSDRIVALIEAADESIWIASGHLRSRPVAEALQRRWAADPDLDIRIYLDGQEHISDGYHWYQQAELDDCLAEAADSEARRQDCLDRGFYFSYELAELDGMPTRFKHYAYRWHYTYAVQMHHKYLIFDGDTVASGSYNLSDNAEHNTMENLVVYRRADYPALVDSFIANFDAIWQTGRDAGLYDALTTEIETATDTIPIVYDPMALTWQEVTDLKDLIEQTCPAVYSDAYDDHPEDHTVCEL